MLTLKPNSGELENVIAEMQKMLMDAKGDEEFLLYARNLVVGSPFSANDQLKTVLEYVKANVRYQPDPVDSELLTSPHRMMERIQQGAAYGDCDCVALFCTAICRALGYEANIVLLDQHGDGYSHAACEVASTETSLMYYMDPTLVSNPLGVASAKMENEPGYRYTPGYVKKLLVN